ncbi:indolepyruvate ferredoxin oxidoreductase subunit alpha [Selenomonadales bacterium OttesenSCG-928-I06]|nr:indolepyruvate ferredoxin oxidoreductase subunit alpha [Selenomonadales bacterium OttesenSCG-928-I06]
MNIIKKELLSGNEAIARGAYEGGLKAAAAYPGTPSTEILENISKYQEVYVEWSPNEKVAAEVAIGASFAGARALTSMKHVGVNVAADPLFSFAYTGVNGGFVLISADDPGCHSSQNEQDNRYYAKFMKIILVEPSDSQEAKDFTKNAFDMSEQFDMPVMVRTTTRISHSKGMVTLEDRKEIPLKPYKQNVQKYVVMPAQARRLRVTLEERLEKAGEFSEIFPGNKIEGNGKEFAIITSGVGANYAREALGDRATYLKLGMTFPLPKKMVTEFIEKHKTVYVIEEGEPFLEEQIKALGLNVIGKELFPNMGELTATMIREILLNEPAKKNQDLFRAEDTPIRPPVLCPGCPHRGVYRVIRRIKNATDAIVTGDIGCYTLGVLAPLNALETCICMGASVSAAIGFKQMMPDRKVIATIGDSTFLHSGVTGLMDAVYNKAAITLIILDNSITGMTGHQQNPSTGFTIRNEPTYKVDLEQMVRACGVQHVFKAKAYDFKGVEAAIEKAIGINDVTVVITEQPCVLIEKKKEIVTCQINSENCQDCQVCLRLGCPAISKQGDGTIAIDQTMCNGCSLCIQVCNFDAIERVGGTNE